MSYSDRPLDNPINWSFRIGRLFDIEIRLHVLFVACAIVLVAMQRAGDKEIGDIPFTTSLVHALGAYAILFAIVLLHEFGHCFGARHTGGEADEILIWPLGGLASTNPPNTPAAHMLTTVAGPLVNVIICAICSVILTIWMGSLGGVPWNPLHPFWPVDGSLPVSTAQFWLMVVFGLSYLLLLFNLLPIFPFDGGRILQTYLWPRKGYVRSMEIATWTGMIGAIVIGLFGLLVDKSNLMLMVAVFGYITCMQQRRIIRDQAAYGMSEFGFDSGFENFHEPAERRPGRFERWRMKRAERKAERERQERAAHEAAVEEILKKVSQEGLRSLTAHERRILEEETKRKRLLSSGPSDR